MGLAMLITSTEVTVAVPFYTIFGRRFFTPIENFQPRGGTSISLRIYVRDEIFVRPPRE